MKKNIKGVVVPPDKVVLKQQIVPEDFENMEEVEKQAEMHINYFGVAFVVLTCVDHGGEIKDDTV